MYNFIYISIDLDNSDSDIPSDESNTKEKSRMSNANKKIKAIASVRTAKRLKVMSLPDKDRTNPEKMMQIQNEFLAEAAWALDVENLKQQHEREILQMKMYINKLEDEVRTKNKYINKMQHTMWNQGFSTDNFFNLDATMVQDEIAANMTALLRIFTSGSSQE